MRDEGITSDKMYSTSGEYWVYNFALQSKENIVDVLFK